MNPIHIDGGGNAFSNSRRNELLLSRPPHQSKVLGKVGGPGGGTTLLQKGFPSPGTPRSPKLFVRRYRLEQTVVGQERFLFNDGGLIKLGMEASHIKCTFPLGDNDGRHGVADEVGQRAGFGH